MPINVYTSLLFGGVDLANGVVVPMGGPDLTHVWVVTDMRATHDLPTIGAVTGFWVKDSAGTPLWFERNWGRIAGRTYAWRGRQLVGAGDSLEFFTEDVGWSLRVTGYELLLP